MKFTLTLILSFLISSSLSLIHGQERQVGEMQLQDSHSSLYKKRGFSPYAGRNFPTTVYWGDTHLHTSNSLDARAFGNVLNVEQAYRLARGEEVVASHGEAVKLSRPLDWLVVADHSDGFGTMNEIVSGNVDLLKDPTVKDWHNRINEGGETALLATMDIINAISSQSIPSVMLDERFVRGLWEEYVETAENYNDPGTFTAIIGYEWTSNENGNNLHRNVLYRDGASKAGQILPYTTSESVNPEDLWGWMENYEEQTGGRLLAIAHNGNLSNGIMFPVEANPASGAALTDSYTQTRIRWEPIYEATQIKGDGGNTSLFISE